ncbi:preprotein translocase subunit SecA [candidate division WWE3 bacterium]|jgi:preprotein translocase subunit SecA|nr:preprotein translocase subunit SecA [candidate division WWE3 bacterium]
MFGKLFDSNERQLKSLNPIVDKINGFEEALEKLSDDELRQKTASWQDALKDKSLEEQNKQLDKILPEAFAVVRETSKRILGLRPYDVQLIAGIVLHQGKITEQRTGEGKTLTATLPMYLNSLTGRGVHLVTPNDYLSRHGAGWMGPLYHGLGITVGVIMQQRAFKYDPDYEGSEFQDEYAIHLKEVPKQEAYQCDVVYGTNHEFGFDYLRDNMARQFSDMVQTNKVGDWGIHNFAIVDEVDSILIDVARTPLIISTSAAQPTERYQQASKIIHGLIKETDYEVEEKYKSATLTDLGIRRVEKLVGVDNLYEQDFEMVHLIEQSLSAHTLYEKDKDYVVKDGAVVIVDQFTGRLLPTNRYSHGLHQAIEAKEGVTVQQESRTLAEISYQNYFRMYSKLAGMTGTAATEAEEFFKIYKLDVMVVPTNKPVARDDHSDVVYKSEGAKYAAVAEEVSEKVKKGQPVLIGTTSVEKSQLVHEQLKRRGVKHEILNAKNHEREALIIAQAGKPGSVTVATNMAGRGVDIKLGGDPATKEEIENIKSLGGLHVIGTERHESRRIDNQLRGRSGRQGDPGSSRFFLSLQDDLMRIFGGEQVEKLMDRFGLDENVPLEASIVSKSIESAQKKVEGFNFDRRKQVVELDDVMNAHREVIYKLRRKILQVAEGNEEAREWFIGKMVQNASFDVAKEWDPHVKHFGEKDWLKIVAGLSLPVIDLIWMEHLVDMDHVREGIGLRGYAQRDPIVEYKREGHERFELLVRKIYQNVSDRLSKVSGEVAAQKVRSAQPAVNLDYKQGSIETGVADEAKAQRKVEPVRSSKDKVGRNDPCPCGSGLKYKKCGMIGSPKHKG